MFKYVFAGGRKRSRHISMTSYHISYGLVSLRSILITCTMASRTGRYTPRSKKKQKDRERAYLKLPIKMTDELLDNWKVLKDSMEAQTNQDVIEYLLEQQVTCRIFLSFRV